MLETIETLSRSDRPVTTSMICLHGLGADGHDLTSLARELVFPETAQAVRFIFPHAAIRTITMNGGARMRGWYDIMFPSLKEDETGIRESTIEIDKLIAHEIARGIPAHRIFLLGFSQGCAMSLQVGLRYPERLGGVIGLSGYLPIHATLEVERSPQNITLPIFLAHGALDPVVSLQYALLSRDILKNLGYHVEWHQYPTMMHQILPSEIRDINDWLGKLL